MKRILVAILLLFLALGNNVTIAIIGTNDIHGAALPTKLQRTQNDSKVEYKYGGLVYLARLINIIKSQYPGNSVYLDAGDQFQGGIESSKLISSGKIMNDFFALQKVNASAIGNHQFDFGPEFLFPFMKAKDGPILAANLRSENNKTNFLPKQQASQMYSFASGIKIGVIGLATLQTPYTTAGFSSGKFPLYKFLQYKQAVISEAQKLRKNGADAVVILGHVGNNCTHNQTYKIWTKEDKQQGYCNETDQMSNLVKSLPEGTIQGVVQGHRHTVSHYFINGVPIMGNINGGFYFNVMYLTFHNKKVVDSKIEGPIPVCEKIFENTGRCQYLNKEDNEKAGRLIDWRFHNQQVYADPLLQTIYQQQWYPLMKPYLIELVNNQVLLTKQTQVQCRLGNLITSLIHSNFTFADFVVLNPGGYRTQWVPGILQEQHLYNMFPFENQLVKFNITGAELLKMIQILQNGDKGFYNFWGIQCTVTIKNQKHSYISSNFYNDSTSSTSSIDPQKTYTGITTDFLIQGGDNFKKVLETYTPRGVQNVGEFRSSIRGQLTKLKVITQQYVYDKQHPRLVIK